MSDPRFERIQHIFDQARSIPPGKRDAFLAEQCGSDRELLQDLQELFANYTEEDRFLESPDEIAGLSGILDEVSEESKPERIGPYKILDVLGEGGMGMVYLAEQSEPVRRRVAVKVIKMGLDSKQVLARFELERQALAIMNHEAIAKVFDAGVTDKGLPYFVMELVQGTPLTHYCDQHRLELAERIKIFQQICHGVQHAHQKGVLHRDLKPNNILVSRKGDRHVPMIIDFGLARATGPRLVEQTIYTEAGHPIGTLEYMSPEQAGGGALDIDTRTDIYSLGVILYQLLTGLLPFASDELRQAGLLEVQRIIREREPIKPSTKISAIGDNATECALKRRMSFGALRKNLRGDLDWIVMRAMAKEPERRYASAASLALDLDRHREHEPVEAGPPSATYRLGKMVRKYRTQVVAGVLIFLAMVAGTVGTTWFMFAAQEQEAIAKLEKKKAEDNAAEAKRENERFDRLSVLVQLEDAKEEEKNLLPAWPDKIGAIEMWLRDRGAVLAAALPEVRRTLRELEAHALPQTEEEESREHPRKSELLALTKMVTALQRAMDVRQGNREPAEVALPANTPESCQAISRIAWPMITPDRKAEAHGQESLGLSLTQRAVALATESERPEALYRHSWALFANGLDEAAKAASAAALEAAQEDQKDAYKADQLLLARTIENSDQTLAAAREQRVELQADVKKRWTWSFADETDRFLHQTMQDAEKKLVAFTGDDGLLERVQQLLDWASRIEHASIERHAQTWEHARLAILRADGETASALYKEHPIDLKPQLGLVPIGMNPVTKLWEFYHLRSAFDPTSDQDPASISIPRHEDCGLIKISGETGIVFVLLPGATFRMGAQSKDPTAPNYDAKADWDEAGHSLTLSPFFLARHELTQGQWLLLSMKASPSRYFPGSRTQGRFVDWRHPVEMVSWSLGHDLAKRQGLVLPTEAQWEYGCRAGTKTPWSVGLRVEGLDGFANFCDRTAIAVNPDWSGEPAPFEDGYVLHAPVGTFRYNAFGLHDMHGNVCEWCRDWYGFYTLPVAAGDGERQVAGDLLSDRVARGGSYFGPAHRGRSSTRYKESPGVAYDNLGLRLARKLTQ